jgi:hypothetical protein
MQCRQRRDEFLHPAFNALKRRLESWVKSWAKPHDEMSPRNAAE